MTIYVGTKAAKLKKLSNFLGLTSSNHPGERAAAALKAADLLRQLGMTWDEVLVAAKLPVSRKDQAAFTQKLRAARQRLDFRLAAEDSAQP